MLTPHGPVLFAAQFSTTFLPMVSMFATTTAWELATWGYILAALAAGIVRVHEATLESGVPLMDDLAQLVVYFSSADT